MLDSLVVDEAGVEEGEETQLGDGGGVEDVFFKPDVVSSEVHVDVLVVLQGGEWEFGFDFENDADFVVAFVFDFFNIEPVVEVVGGEGLGGIAFGLSGFVDELCR